MSSSDRARELIASTFDLPVEEVTLEGTDSTVPGWDSFGHVTLMMALEEAVGETIDAAEMGKLTSVAAIADFLGKSSSDSR